jgi:hypothetical protein
MSALHENKSYPTTPGWYCLGFERFDTALQGDIGPAMEGIYRFDGQDWFDEAGCKKEGIYDPELCLDVAMDAADYYVPS